MRKLTEFLISIAISVTFAQALPAFAKDEIRNSYLSETDKNLTVRTVAILPSSDNVNGLYSRYAESKVAALVSEGHRFALTEVKEADPRLTVDDYEKQPEVIRTLSQKNNVDAFIVTKIVKNPKNLSIQLDLFLGSDGLVFASEQIDNDPKFQLTDVEKKIADLYSRAVNKLPYKGLILSRQNQRVTLDIGSSDGIKNDSVLTVEQVISIKRHPKYNFMLSSEKEIIGKIKIVKAEPKLSFGIILQEKEKGVITKNSKVSGLDFVQYPDSSLQGPAGPPQDVVSFGKNPREWKLDKEPSLGYAGMGIGLGNFQYASTLQQSGSITGSNSLYPQIDFHGEIWITRNWYVGGKIRYGVFSIGNALSGSTPGNLSANNGHFDLHAGYKFLLQDEFWGPQIIINMGFSKYSLFVDASTPLAYTSTSYSGLYLGIGGLVPIDEERIWYFEASLSRHLFPIMTETPLSSGASSDNTITVLSIGASRKLNTAFRIHGSFDFESYSSTFSGGGSRGDTGSNSSQTLITLVGGLDYYF